MAILPEKTHKPTSRSVGMEREAFFMFGILIWTPPERRKRQKTVETAERVILHTRFTCIYVLRGPRTPEAVVRRRVASAARKFQRLGIRRVVLPEVFAYEALLARRDLEPVDTLTLRRELASELVRRGLEDRELSGGRVAVSSDTMSAELVRTVTELALRCRYVLLDVPFGGEELAGRLRREYGVSLLLAPDRAQLEAAEALVLFAPRTDLRRDNPVVVEAYRGAAAPLPTLLLPPAMEEQLPAGCCRTQLLAALRESGALRPGQISLGRDGRTGNGLGA